jgi:L-seryl-tRNA(Ser) seleniumtransferase
VGGGSLPGETLPSWAVAAPAGGQPHRLAEKLRRLDRPIVGRIAEDRLLLDLRTVDPADDGDLIHALTSLSD